MIYQSKETKECRFTTSSEIEFVIDNMTGKMGILIDDEKWISNFNDALFLIND